MNFNQELLKAIQKIRYTLEDFENFEDGMEMIFVAQEMAADLEQLEEKLEEEIESGR